MKRPIGETKMKRSALGVWIFATCASILLASPVVAQVPQTLSVQGILRDATGVPIEGPTSFAFRLVRGGADIWTETHSVDLTGGLFTIILGADTPITPELLAGAPPSLVLSVEGEALAPIELTSVPYALHAGSAETVAGDVSWDQLVDVPAGFADGTDDGAGGGSAGGVVFTHWGRSDCPADTTLVYSGFAAGGRTNHGGGGTTICLIDTPTWDNFNDANNNGTLIYGVEYETTSYGLSSVSPFNTLQNEDAPCAVCLDEAADVEMMLPGSQMCPTGWNTRVAGYLMSHHYTQSVSDLVCVSRDAQAMPGSSSGNEDGHLWYPAESECGPLPCGPGQYVQDRELTCAICTR